MSFNSLAQPNPRLARPRTSASADDKDFDLCNEFVFVPGGPAG